MGEGPRELGEEGRSRLTLSQKLALAIAGAWLAVIWLWDPAFLTLTVDDSFYYFTIARHVAAGHGLTFDGIQSTSGFHPLWLVVLVPFGPLLRVAPDTAVRLILSLQVGLSALGAKWLGRRTAIVFAVSSLVFSFTKIFVNGLESALEFVLLAAAITAAERALAVSERRERAIVLVGVLSGLLVLARLSAILGAPLLVLLVVVRTRPDRRTVMAAAGATLGPALAYAIFLFLRYGHPTPVSAAIKYGRGYLSWGFGAIPIAATVAFLAVALRREIRGPSWPVWALPLGAWVGVQLSCDALLRHMIVPEIWYLVPHATLFVLLAAAAIERRPVLRWGAVGLVAFAAAVWVARVRRVTYSFYAEARDVGAWLAASTPPDARIAGWDCGIAAFYSNRAFMNLDGLASSWEYKTEYLDKLEFGRFLVDRDVSYVAQYVPIDEPLSEFHGVADLSTWEVVLDRPYEFRGIVGTVGEPARRFRYVVLRRR